MAETKTDIQWEAPEFVHYPKTKKWFLGMGILGIAVVVFFLIQKDFIAGLMFALLFALVYHFARAKPRMLKVKISSEGVKLNQTLVRYKQLKKFWIVYEPPTVKTLNFETLAYINRHLSLQLESQDPVALREFLLNFLPEDLEKEETVPEKFSRRIGF